MAPIPGRIKKLRKELFSTADSTCFSRARFFTEVYKRTESETPGRRQAAALYETFTQMPIFIRPDELIVGQRSSRLGARILYPEYNLDGLKNWSEEAYGYWKTRTLGHFTKSRHPQELVLAEAESAAGYQTGTDTGYGHMMADYPEVLRNGLAEIIRRADAGAAAAQDDAAADFYESVSLTCRGIISWAERYADLADAEAETASERRAAELREIARICRKVPAYPAETFHEALQSFWFIHIALHIEQHGWSISTGRFDQYMSPYFSAEPSSEDSRELLLSLWMKFMENIGSKIRATTFQNLTIGGQLEDGSDACNALTLACLDATADLGMNQPALSFRWHSNISQAVWEKVVETISKGSGMPALFNDAVIIPALIEKGTTSRDAFNYGIVGCVEAAVPGKQQGVTAGGHINLAKALELALNNGESTTTGKKIGVSTGDPAHFDTYDQLWSAYTKQIDHLCDLNIKATHISGDEQKKHVRYPLLSSLLDDCMEKGSDLVFGSVKYRLPGVGVFGSSNVYDGLAAIRKHVFTDQTVSMAELSCALRENYSGREGLRALLANESPR
ncbi:MAG: hypothetical protein HN368_07655, partial [Spirochaetales bacterium]|nr:hypothetical protein [Spirochaetales bacterium]